MPNFQQKKYKERASNSRYQSYIFSRNGTLYFRITVPNHLQSLIKKLIWTPASAKDIPHMQERLKKINGSTIKLNSPIVSWFTRYRRSIGIGEQEW